MRVDGDRQLAAVGCDRIRVRRHVIPAGGRFLRDRDLRIGNRNRGVSDKRIGVLRDAKRDGPVSLAAHR